MDTATSAESKAGAQHEVCPHIFRDDCLSGVLRLPPGPSCHSDLCWSPAHHELILSTLLSYVA